MQVSVDVFLDQLYRKHHGRKFLVGAGSRYGDAGKGAIEATLREHIVAFVRPSGGANTGRTGYVCQPDGTWVPFIFHQIPVGWAYGKLAIIGDWVLLDLERGAQEITDLIQLVGQPAGDLMISKHAPLNIIYDSLFETWLEYSLGKQAVGTTKRGISPTIACDNLRIGPRAEVLADIDLFYRWIKRIYEGLLPILKALEDQQVIKDFRVAEVTPDKVMAQLEPSAEIMRPFITDVDQELHRLARENVPTFFGMTQGFGLHLKKGTYPYCSSTQTLASAAAYCTGLPMSAFGGVILVAKLFGTRVGNGPQIGGLWDRIAAEQFPIDHPELFSALPDHDPEARQAFLSEKRRLINSGTALDIDLAQYIQVAGNELGATSGRGREPGLPDLYMDACAADVNGADCLALTRSDLLSGLKFRLPFCVGYELDGELVNRPTIPSPIGELERAVPCFEYLDTDLENIDIAGADCEEALPPCLHQMIAMFERHVGIPLGIFSTSGGVDGKIFRSLE